MQPEFWRERWQRNEIGFHQDLPHKALEAHWARLQLQPGSRVFVPLAGKSLDMLWLARRGHAVVGVELAPEAVAAFATEQGPQPRIDLRCGDIFDLTSAALGPVAAVFDRAALIALPPALRQRYATQMASLTAAGTRTLLVTLEYEQSRMSGPPHSVPEDEVHALFDATHHVELLERDNALSDFPKFAQRGVPALSEAVYLLERLEIS